MKKILIIGDYEIAPYHPLTGVEDELKSIIGNNYSVEVSGDYASFLNLEKVDLLILYTDNWNQDAFCDDALASFITYVANGGSVLAIHSGISLQSRKEFTQVIGAKFDHHPAMENMTISAVNPDETITKGLEDFVTFEEPYNYIFDNLDEITVLTEYTYKEKKYINSWKKKFAKGEIVYLMNGHTANHFKEKGNRILIKNSVEYLLK